MSNVYVIAVVDGVEKRVGPFSDFEGAGKYADGIKNTCSTIRIDDDTIECPKCRQNRVLRGRGAFYQEVCYVCSAKETAKQTPKTWEVEVKFLSFGTSSGTRTTKKKYLGCSAADAVGNAGYFLTKQGFEEEPIRGRWVQIKTRMVATIGTPIEINSSQKGKTA